jgi:hypothetical protein
MKINIFVRLPMVEVKFCGSQNAQKIFFGKGRTGNI